MPVLESSARSAMFIEIPHHDQASSVGAARNDMGLALYQGACIMDHPTHAAPTELGQTRDTLAINMALLTELWDRILNGIGEKSAPPNSPSVSVLSVCSCSSALFPFATFAPFA